LIHIIGPKTLSAIVHEQRGNAKVGHGVSLPSVILAVAHVKKGYLIRDVHCSQ